MQRRILNCLLGAAVLGAWLGTAADSACGQSFAYQPKPRVSTVGPTYASPDPAPTMMRPSEAAASVAARPQRGYLYPRSAPSGMAERLRYETNPPRYARNAYREQLPHPASRESIGPGKALDPFGDQPPSGPTGETGSGEYFERGPNGGYSPEMVEGEMAEGHMFDGEMADGEMLDGDGCCPSCGGCNGCNQCEGLSCCGFIHCVCHCLRQTYLFSPCMWQNLSIYSGKQGFKNPTDQGINGDFGYHAGANWGSPLWNRFNIGYQLGGAILLSDFEGRSGPFGHRRSQYFVTTGVFRRAQCRHGLQGGVVVDYLADNFYVNMNLLQIRGEISYVYNAHEVGFWFAAHTNSDTQTPPIFLEQQSVTWQANNQYNLFYRYQFCNGSTARTWAGLTGHGDGLFGSDAVLPFSPKWGLQASCNYLLPRHDDAVPDNVKESWSLMISLVWFPGYRCTEDWFNAYRPLIPVADNGWFIENVR